MSQKTMQQYEAALNDLKKVNDDLFYRDLKDYLSKHQKKVESQLAKSKEMNEKVLSTLNNYNKTFHEDIKGLSDQAASIVEEQIAEFNNHFEIAKEQLQAAYASFQTIAETYQTDMEEAQKTWTESFSLLSSDVHTISDNQRNMLLNQFDSVAKMLSWESNNVVQQISTALKQFDKDNKEYISAIDKSHRYARESQLNRLQQSLEEREDKSREQLAFINLQLVKQEELGERLQALIQQYQSGNVEARNSLHASHKKELEVLKKEINELKTKPLKWIILLGVLQILLSGGVLYSILLG